MNDKKIIKSISVSMIMKPISMAVSFVYAPLALSFLGQEKYGIWAIILNIVSWINYFDIGIGNGLKNRLAEAVAKDDKENAQCYVSTAYVGTFFISTVFGIVVSVLWKLLNLSDFFNLNVGNENVDQIVIISVLFVCINFVISLSKTCAYAIQQPQLTSITEVVGQILSLAILLIINRFMNESLMAVALMYGSISVLCNYILKKYINRKNGFLKFKWSKVNMEYMKPLLTIGIGFFVMQICTLVLNTTDNLLISNLYGSAEVTPYNMVYKVFYVLVQVHAIIIMPMWPAYTAANAVNDIAWIKSTMRKINLVTLGLSICAVIGIFLFEPFAAIWLGQRLEYGKRLIVLVAIYMIVQMFVNNYSSFLCGVGHIKVSTIISIIGAVVNIPFSVFFARNCGMGLSGIILGSLCVMGISFFILPVVTHKWLEERETSNT